MIKLVKHSALFQFGSLLITCADVENKDNEQVMTVKEGLKAKERIGYSQV